MALIWAPRHHRRHSFSDALVEAPVSETGAWWGRFGVCCEFRQTAGDPSISVLQLDKSFEPYENSEPGGLLVTAWSALL